MKKVLKINSLIFLSVAIMWSGCGKDSELVGGTFLVTEGVVAQYTFNEVKNGQGSTVALDSFNLSNLNITYVGAVLNYFLDAANNFTGLDWTTAGDNSRACADIATQDIKAKLDTQKQATIETVVAIAEGINAGAVLVHIGEGANNRHTLLYDEDDKQILYVHDNATTTRWNVDLTTKGRSVVHLVLDTDQAVAADRTKLYLNNVAQVADGASTFPALAAPLDFSAALTFHCVGNREAGGASPKGSIYFLAHYAIAFNSSQVDSNFNILSVLD